MRQLVPPDQTVALRRINGLGVAATLLIVAVLMARLAFVIGDWQAYARMQAIATEGPLKPGSMVLVTNVSPAVLVYSVIAALVATVALLTWVWRARKNAELIDSARRFRFSPAFAVGAWLVPVANIWWSRAVLDELWAASRPDGDPGTDGHSPLVRAWWVCVLGDLALWILSLFTVGRLAVIEADPGSAGLDAALNGLRSASMLSSIGLGLAVTGTILLGSLILRISRWQSPR